MSELNNKAFKMYQDGKEISKIAHDLGVAESFIRQIIKRKIQSQ